MKTYDLIVIGAGPGGYEAAIRAAQLGLQTALIEERQVGGTCLNRGCVPIKSMLHSAQIYHQAKESDLFGVETNSPVLHMEKVHARKEEVLAKLRSGIGQLIKANKIALYEGHGTITGPHTVEVTGQEEPLEGKNILIATGSQPARPPIPGLALPNVVTSDDLLNGEEFLQGKLYQNLIIIGGGVISMEFASLYSAIGCQVTVVEAMDRILPTMDRELSQNLAMILKKRGVTIHTGAMVKEISQGEEGLCCSFTVKEESKQAWGDGILVAIGRRPNTKGLLQEGFTLEMERGRIIVNEQFQTSIPSIYAIGDVSSKVQLAHVASAQGICAVEQMAGQTPSICLDAIPGCIYTDPEIASVGITEDQAKAQGIPVKKGKFLMGGNAKSLIENQERGFIKVLFHAETGKLLGAQMMCARATDMVGELSTAVVNGLTQHQLAAVIRPHPTFVEGITEAAEDAQGQAIHMAPRRR